MPTRRPTTAPTTPLRQILDQRGIRHNELAHIWRCSEALVARILSGEYGLSIERAELAAEFLNRPHLSPQELMRVSRGGTVINHVVDGQVLASAMADQRELMRGEDS